MRFRSCYIPTLKETPADAEVISQKLLIRAGMIRKLTSGVYTYMPLALRSLRKIEKIIREEMDRVDFVELLLPMVQPGDLWKESGRWEHYGRELLRFKDRNDRDYCLGPTHEEVMTDLLRGEVRSYKQLPARPYQIQTKFRDEIRPRFGLMRGREFIMKDGYSFDCDDEGASRAFQDSSDAYNRIFTRMGLRYREVDADSGSIGGKFSHEFHVLAEAGEDTIASCTSCRYAANIERCEGVWKGEKNTAGCAPMEKVATPGAHTVADVARFLGVPVEQVVKTMIFNVDGKPVAKRSDSRQAAARSITRMQRSRRSGAAGKHAGSHAHDTERMQRQEQTLETRERERLEQERDFLRGGTQDLGEIHTRPLHQDDAKRRPRP